MENTDKKNGQTAEHTNSSVKENSMDVPAPAKTVAGIQVTKSIENKDSDSNKKAYIEDNLELRRMKFKDRIKAKRNRLKSNTEGMSNWEKFKYYVYYYKWHVVIGLLILFCVIAIPTAIYKNSRPVSISYAVVNSPAPESINEKLFNEYASYYNMVDGYQIRNSLSVTLSQADYETEFAKEEGDSSYTQFPTLCWNNYFDIIITNETGLHYCTTNSLVQPLEDRLYDDIYEEIKTKHPKRIIQSPNYDKYPAEFAIDISGTEFVQKLNVGYDDVYVCFPGGSEENLVNIRRFLKYVLELDVEI